jgi:O-antigen/teichoic acid export membrane protein
MLKKLVNFSLWNFFGSGLFSAANIISLFIITKYLIVVDVGRINAIIQSIGIFSLFSSSPVGTAIIKFISPLRENNQPELKNKLFHLAIVFFVTLFVTTFFFLVLANSISEFFNDINLSFFIKIATPWFFLFCINEVMTSIFYSLNLHKKFVKVQIIRSIFLITTSYFLTLNFQLIGFIFANIIVLIFTNAYQYFILKNEFKNQNFKNIYFNINEAKIIFKFTTGTLISSLSTLPFIYISNGILSSRRGINNLALLNISNTYRGILTFFPIAFGKIILSFIGDSTSNSSEQRVEKFQLSNWINNLLIWPLFIFFLLYSSTLLEFHGQNYVDGIIPFKILIGATALGFLGNAFGGVLISDGNYFISFFANLLTGLSILFLTFFEYNLDSLIMYSLGFLFGYLLNLLITIYVISTKLRLSRNFVLKQILMIFLLFFLVLINLIYNLSFNLFSSIIISILSLVLIFFVYKPSFIKIKL